MSCLFNDIVEHEYQRGQESNDGDNAEDNALCHDKTHILAEREAHEAQRKEAENGCQRAAIRERKVESIAAAMASFFVSWCFFSSSNLSIRKTE